MNELAWNGACRMIWDLEGSDHLKLKMGWFYLTRWASPKRRSSRRKGESRESSEAQPSVWMMDQWGDGRWRDGRWRDGRACIGDRAQVMCLPFLLYQAETRQSLPSQIPVEDPCHVRYGRWCILITTGIGTCGVTTQGCSSWKYRQRRRHLCVEDEVSIYWHILASSWAETRSKTNHRVSRPVAEWARPRYVSTQAYNTPAWYLLC